jgi:hypothetical protein
MRSKYIIVKTGRVKYSWSKWEDIWQVDAKLHCVYQRIAVKESTIALVLDQIMFPVNISDSTLLNRSHQLHWFIICRHHSIICYSCYLFVSFLFSRPRQKEFNSVDKNADFFLQNKEFFKWRPLLPAHHTQLKQCSYDHHFCLFFVVRTAPKIGQRRGSLTVVTPVCAQHWVWGLHSVKTSKTEGYIAGGNGILPKLLLLGDLGQLFLTYFFIYF